MKKGKVYYLEGKKLLRLRIKEVLAEKKISQSKLSRKADVSLNTIQELIHDPLRDVRLSTLDKIADALGVEITALYEKTPD